MHPPRSVDLSSIRSIRFRQIGQSAQRHDAPRQPSKTFD